MRTLKKAIGNRTKRTINEFIERLSSLDNSKIQSNKNNKIRIKDDVRIETVIEYWLKSEENNSKFK